MPVPVLELEGISKRFGDVIANKHVGFDLQAGEVHALVGENGAGKTTLMRILFGMIRPDSGPIRLSGRTVQFRSPRDALAEGIGMVHQHFMLVPELSVLANAVLGAEPSRFGLADERAAIARLREPMRLLGMETDLHATAGHLSVAKQQRLEILKVLYRGARIIILDEPTAVLTPQETDDLFATLRRFAEEGYSIVFISHKLREVMSVADRVTVLRDGRTIETRDIAGARIPELVAAMTGRTTVNLGRVERAPHGPDVVLSVEGLAGSVAGDLPIRDVSFAVRAGEVVGFAGVDGNGQDSLAGLLAGLGEVTAGTVRLRGEDLTRSGISTRRLRGLAYVPADRHAEGMPMSGTVLEALAGERLSRRSGWSVLGPAFPRFVRAWAAAVLERFSIRAAGIDARCSSLSGGNQQKIVLARELESSPGCLILVQPTRGVDLGATDFLYSTIAAATAAGTAAVLVSADLDELLRLADRILVLYRGRIVAEHDARATTRAEIGHDMAGLGREAAA